MEISRFESLLTFTTVMLFSVALTCAFPSAGQPAEDIRSRPTAPESSSPPGRYIGTNVHYGYLSWHDPAKTIQLMKDASLNTFRDTLAWGWVEKQRGVYAMGSETLPFRQAVDMAVKNGIEPLLILVYGNRAYAGNIAAPEDGGIRDAFAQYAAYTARYFGNKVKMYEVWNEWNGGNYQGCKWTEPCASAVTYADLLCKTYKQLKSVDPSIVVVGGAVQGSGSAKAWIQTLLDNGAGSCMDVLSLHPYQFHWDRTWRKAVGPSDEVDRMMAYIDSVHTMVKNKTGRDIPIYITEEGMRANGTAEEQMVADYLVQVVTKAKTRPFIMGIWWYDLRDDGDNYGIVRSDYSAKPAYRALKSVAPGW